MKKLIFLMLIIPVVSYFLDGIYQDSSTMSGVFSQQVDSGDEAVWTKTVEPQAGDSVVVAAVYGGSPESLCGSADSHCCLKPDCCPPPFVDGDIRTPVRRAAAFRLYKKAKSIALTSRSRR